MVARLNSLGFPTSGKKRLVIQKTRRTETKSNCLEFPTSTIRHLPQHHRDCSKFAHRRPYWAGTAEGSFERVSVGYHLMWKIAFKEILKVDTTNGNFWWLCIACLCVERGEYDCNLNTASAPGMNEENE